MYLPFHFLVCFYGNEYTAGCLFLLPWRFLIQYTFYSSGPSITLESSHCKLFQDFFFEWSDCSSCLKILRHFPKYSSLCQENTLAQRKRMALDTYIHLNSECLASMTLFCWSSWNCYHAMQNWTCPFYGNGISFTVPNHQSSFYNSWHRSFIRWHLSFI